VRVFGRNDLEIDLGRRIWI